MLRQLVLRSLVQKIGGPLILSCPLEIVGLSVPNTAEHGNCVTGRIFEQVQLLQYGH